MALAEMLAGCRRAASVRCDRSLTPRSELQRDICTTELEYIYTIYWLVIIDTVEMQGCGEMQRDIVRYTELKGVRLIVIDAVEILVGGLVRGYQVEMVPDQAPDQWHCKGADCDRHHEVP